MSDERDDELRLRGLLQDLLRPESLAHPSTVAAVERAIDRLSQRVEGDGKAWSDALRRIQDKCDPYEWSVICEMFIEQDRIIDGYKEREESQREAQGAVATECAYGQWCVSAECKKTHTATPTPGASREVGE